MTSANPFEAPKVEIDRDASELSADEITRNEHIKHEASVRSVGTLWLFFALLAVSFALASLVLSGDPISLAIAISIAVAYGWCGTALRQLHPASRWAGAVLALPTMFPPLILYTGYLLLSKKGGTVLSEDYARVRANTPDIKYKTPLFLLITITFVVLLLLLALITPFFVGASQSN